MIINRQKVIVFKNVYKSYVINRENKLKQKLVSLGGKTKKYIAIDNMNLVIRKKETVGFYGPNGSGKTTILRLIAAITQPDRGKVEVRGKVAPVLEFGSGLHPELSGRDNIYLYGSILGIERREVDKKIKGIIDFAGLEEFINTPVKKYSLGMKARLGFSIAITTEPDILLVDEVLSVGDQSFQQRCLRVLEKFKKKGTLVLVSHNLSLLMSMCDRIVLLSEGKIESRSLKEEMNVKEFFIAMLKDGQKLEVEALSDSMSPKIKLGDKLIIKKVAFKKLKKGDIIAFEFDSLTHFIVHRIVGKMLDKGKISFITKGDANYVIDSWLVDKSNYVGRIKKIVRG